MTTPDYETDFYAWMQQQAQALRAHGWAAVLPENPNLL